MKNDGNKYIASDPNNISYDSFELVVYTRREENDSFGKKTKTKQLTWAVKQMLFDVTIRPKSLILVQIFSINAHAIGLSFFFLKNEIK